MMQAGYLSLLVAGFLLITGCTSAGPTAAPATSQSSNPSPTTTALAASPSPTGIQPGTVPGSVTPRGPDQGRAWTVTITRVIDGDTIEAKFPNGDTDTVRLLGVDTPEPNLGRLNPDEYEGIPDTAAGRDHLFTWGVRATSYTTDRLAGETVRIEVDPTADRRGDFGRLLAYVYLDSEIFNKHLLSEGYARLYESSFSRRTAFAQTEATAQANRIGMWDFNQTSTGTPTATPPAASPPVITE